MRLDDCDFNSISGVSMAPFVRNAPEDEWANAASNGIIPSSLYDLYQRANFLSFGASPRFLSDGESILWSYFALVLRSIHSSLVDAHEQAASFAAARELVYDPAKMRRGERWEKDADKRARRHFRDLLIALQSSLDSLADVIAIFFPGCISGLKIGRAQFSTIEAWFTGPPPTASVIAAPSEFCLNKLYDAVKALILAPHPETDWLPMMHLLRNKSVHLAEPMFRLVGLPQVGDGRFFAFIPRQWPYLWESLMTPPGQQPRNPSLLPQLLRDTLIHQDIVTYSCDLLAKVKAVIAAASPVLNETYDQFKDLPHNQSALAELKSNFKKYDFENFV
jgi:hypothetical protein